MKKHYDQLPPISGVNYVPLSPITFLRRAAEVYPQRTAIRYGARHYTWAQTAERCRRLAAALQAAGIQPGDTVSTLAANTPEQVEAHFGVAMAGAVLNAINTRLDADTIAYILEHGNSRLLITDSHFSAAVKQAIRKLKNPPQIIDILDKELEAPAGGGESLGSADYEAWLAAADPLKDYPLPGDEWDALTLNYTSGTTNKPKGVVYHHRGAYLLAMGTIANWALPKTAVYLYTVPLFHCNGWCHVWALAAMGGAIICHRVMTAEAIMQAITQYQVSHFGAAPIILAMLTQQAGSWLPPARVEVMTAGAPPPSKVLEKTTALNFNVTHVYGLTETFGHVLYCDWQPEWDALPASEQADMRARQGIPMLMQDDAAVVDVQTGQPVPNDGQTMGEVLLRGNATMKGYYKSPEQTATAFANGWFHSGDLAVRHPNGQIELKDRLKDIIISGGENISSIEVESALYKHPQVAAAAVVAKPDPKWGETPCAFVELKPQAEADAAALIEFCRANLAHYKCPREIVFTELPKTSTGKIQKFKLRAQVKAAE